MSHKRNNRTLKKATECQIRQDFRSLLFASLLLPSPLYEEKNFIFRSYPHWIVYEQSRFIYVCVCNIFIKIKINYMSESKNKSLKTIAKGIYRYYKRKRKEEINKIKERLKWAAHNVKRDTSHKCALERLVYHTHKNERFFLETLIIKEMQHVPIEN
jgi:hypothetical protein